MRIAKIITGAHELRGLTVGQTVTLNIYKNARVGTGMNEAGAVTGRLVQIGEIIRNRGCSFAWQQAEVDTEA